jgi:hypothetical protein
MTAQNLGRYRIDTEKVGKTGTIHLLLDFLVIDTSTTTSSQLKFSS